MVLFDTSDANHASLVDRLTRDEIGWVATVFPSGKPVSSPVWFLWWNNEILVYSEETAKVSNIEHQAQVAFNLNSDVQGYDILAINGTAVIDRSFAKADELPENVAKYASSIEGIGHTPASFAAAYHVPIRITPASFRSM